MNFSKRNWWLWVGVSIIFGILSILLFASYGIPTFSRTNLLSTQFLISFFQWTNVIISFVSAIFGIISFASEDLKTAAKIKTYRSLYEEVSDIVETKNELDINKSIPTPTMLSKSPTLEGIGNFNRTWLSKYDGPLSLILVDNCLPIDDGEYKSVWENTTTVERLFLDEELEQKINDYAWHVKELNNVQEISVEDELVEIKNGIDRLDAYPEGMILDRETPYFDVPIDDDELPDAISLYDFLYLTYPVHVTARRKYSIFFQSYFDRYGMDQYKIVRAWDEEYPGWDRELDRMFLSAIGFVFRDQLQNPIRREYERKKERMSSSPRVIVIERISEEWDVLFGIYDGAKEIRNDLNNRLMEI